MKRGILLLITLFFGLTLIAQTAEELTKTGVAKWSNEDFNGSIKDFTKAIALNPNYADAYWGRGIAKFNLQDFNNAIADFTKAIELKSDNALVMLLSYLYRGESKHALKDYQGAIND